MRTDLPDDPLELGCAEQLLAPLKPVTWEIAVERTPMQDAEIRCYAIDFGGNVSEYSANAGIADFTPPGRPWVVVHP